VIPVILPVELRVAEPENPLPPPGGEEVIDWVEFLYFEQVPAGICTVVIHPTAVFIFTVPVALLRVLVVGDVVKLTEGVVPDV
jgi:hypothetical protein